ncbi:hypothetical protein LB535_25150 [Mesorhizobium sp. CA10]|uniref:hypothetical protein n=1 Tax=Mesorhizobium sp. CA10 TaxID=588495 RepID=UPI001CCF7D3E|nr:hypothetical protein [Mesorhizobium sp. CA10]MBZ9885631.1 hypothetical protein [Mesorhizobium sp. CA10]
MIPNPFCTGIAYHDVNRLWPQQGEIMAYARPYALQAAITGFAGGINADGRDYRHAEFAISRQIRYAGGGGGGSDETCCAVARDRISRFVRIGLS